MHRSQAPDKCGEWSSRSDGHASAGQLHEELIPREERGTPEKMRSNPARGFAPHSNTHLYSCIPRRLSLFPRVSPDPEYRDLDVFHHGEVPAPVP